MNIVLTGGMTGGHIIPLLRLKERLQGHNFIYVGFKGSLEEQIVKDILFIGLTKKKKGIRFFFYNQYKTELSKLDNMNIGAVISTGGAHSYPMLRYARSNNIPYYLIEENYVFGSINNLFKKKAKKVFTSFPNKKYIYSINPTTFFIKPSYQKEYDITFIGGSLGSDIISKLALSFRKTNLNVVLVCGRKYEKYKKYQTDNFVITSYVDSIELFSKSKMVICRGGASTIFELVKINIPFIIVPMKKSKKNHQVLNAKFFSKNNLAVYLDEKEATHEVIKKLLQFDYRNMLESQRDFINSFEEDIYERTIV